MGNIKTLLKLEYTALKNKNIDKMKKRNYIFSFITSFLLVLVFSFLFVGVFYLIGDKNEKLNYLSFILMVIQVIIFFSAISNIIKTVYLTFDKTMLSYLPVSKWEIYIAKLLICAFKNFVLAITLTLPTLFVFGIFYDLVFIYFVISIFVSLFIMILPFSLATIVSMPIMFVYNWLKNKNIVSLISSIAIIVGLFYLYSKLVFNIADIILLNSKKTNILISFANVFESHFFPSTWIAKALLVDSFWAFFILFVIVSLFVLTLSILVGISTYENIFVNMMIEKNVARTLKSNNKKQHPFLAFFKMELKETIRSSNYSFTYFGMSIAMPIMVLICNNFIVEFAIEKLGHTIIFGTTLLVVLIFVSMICSPTAAFISKEGESFWILKTNPLGIKYPLLAKSLVGVLSCFVGLVLSFVVLIAFKFVTVSQAFAIIMIATIFMVGIIALGMYFNLRKPNIFEKNYQNNSNVINLMLVGFLISIIIGIMAMIISFYRSIVFIILMIVFILTVLSILAIVLLFASYKKLYSKMEV